MSTKKSNIVLHFDIYVKDNWYGKYYRTVLIPEENKFFQTIGDAKKYAAKFKAFLKKTFPHNKMYQKLSTQVSSNNELKDNNYCANGPGIYYNRSTYTLEEILNS